MAIYKGKSGRVYTAVQPSFNKGGEGALYSIEGMPGYVLKIFFAGKNTVTRHRKLLTMMDSPMSAAAMQQVTWPEDVVYENGKFAGYVMRRLSGTEELNVMYSGTYKCSLDEKITIAKNLCAAVNSVHEAGQVCGDLNPGNIGVDPQSGRITLMDTDSYHITDRVGTVYRCPVGLPEYISGEVQVKMKNGERLDTAPLPTYTIYTDLFALAVHIFALLMNGCHPFACAIDNKCNMGRMGSSMPSVSAPQPIENICSGFFPFHIKKAGITTPPYAPSFDALPVKIQDLFVQAFVAGHNNPASRPDPVAWYNALSEMQNNLVKCSRDSYHMYPKELSSCPICDAEIRAQHVAFAAKTVVPPVRPTAPLPASVPRAAAQSGTTYSSAQHGYINTGTKGSHMPKIVAAVVVILIIIIVGNNWLSISRSGSPGNGSRAGTDQSNENAESYDDILDDDNDVIAADHSDEEEAERYRDEYILPESNSAYISESDLEGLSQEEVRLARNEIYARHGRKFAAEELSAYFSGKSWYTEQYEGDYFDSIQEELFNEYEKQNIKTIVAYEEDRGYK